MKQVSIQELKNQLSAVINAASRGEAVLVTKHGQPIVRIEPTQVSPSLHVGKHAARTHKRVKPGINIGLGSMALQVLLEDRRSER